jgi:CheY-like chemotaxis protein
LRFLYNEKSKTEPDEVENGGNIMPSHRKRPVILIAEDDVDDRFLIGDALAEAGLVGEARFVDDGEELVDELHRSCPACPDLVILDLKMPRKGGWETLAEIQSNPGYRHLPVFILTTSNDEDDRQRAVRMGASGYFTKPVTFTALVEVIRQMARTLER